MVIEKILKQLTPERVKKEIEAIQKIKLPRELQKWVREYEKVGKRNEFLWKWVYKGVQKTTFPTVWKEHQKSVREIKFLTIVYVTFVDDFADRAQSKTLLNELLKVPLGPVCIKSVRVNQKEKKYLKFAIKIWDYIEKTIKTYPRYKEFEDIFEYDIAQVINAMKYSYLINKNRYLVNTIEYWLYLPYNMQSFISCTIDLMCSPKFNLQEFRIMRKITWYFQKMVRIGNCVSTWERELNEGDFTSGIINYAVECHIITPNELEQESKLEIIKKIKESEIEKNILKEWEQCYWEIKKFSKEVKTINVKEILSWAEDVLTLHFISKGYI